MIFFNAALEALDAALMEEFPNNLLLYLRVV
jgi:hypothetical protein